jgi:hypothetical protein
MEGKSFFHRSFTSVGVRASERSLRNLFSMRVRWKWESENVFPHFHIATEGIFLCVVNDRMFGGRGEMEISGAFWIFLWASKVEVTGKPLRRVEKLENSQTIGKNLRRLSMEAIRSNRKRFRARWEATRNEKFWKNSCIFSNRKWIEFSCEFSHSFLNHFLEFLADLVEKDLKNSREILR